MKWSNKNVLITGISGFVGSYLARHLLSLGANVFGLIRFRADGSISRNITDKNIDGSVTMIEGDLTNLSSIATAVDVSEPDYIFHLGAQSFVHRSFINPLETIEINTLGTANLLEAIRIKDIDPVVIFAGSSEEYGLVFSSERQYEMAKNKYGEIFPEPERIPELPIDEHNPLRPMSPYAVTKVHGEFLMREYYHTYGIKTITSRAFNHEGAGRGSMFVTSVITNQVMRIKYGAQESITIGNVNTFRDWSHVEDILNGYLILAEKGRHGGVYVQGSKRTNSVLSYILLSLELAGWNIKKIVSISGRIEVDNPTEPDNSEMFGVKFDKTKVDRMMLNEEIEFDIRDKGIVVHTDDGKIMVVFDEKRFRPSDVPILMSNTSKIEKLGFKVRHSLADIIRDQLNYYADPKNR